METTTNNFTHELVLNSTSPPDTTTTLSGTDLPDSPNSSAILLILTKLNEEEAIRQIPLTVFLGILSLVGLCGNLLVCYIYVAVYKVSNSRVFITCLAVIDLCTCAFAMPVEIVTVLNQYQFDAPWTCKISRFINSLTTASSVSVLLLIAVDRFRKICRPLKWQISNRNAKCLCVAAIFSGISVSWPNLVLYGVKSTALVLTPTLNGTATECSMDDACEGTIWPLINGFFSLFVFVVGFGLLTVLYALIGKKVRFFAGKSERRRASSTTVIDAAGRETIKRKQNKLNELNSEMSSYDDVEEITSNGKRSNGTIRTVKSIETVTSTVEEQTIGPPPQVEEIEDDPVTDESKRNTLSRLINSVRIKSTVINNMRPTVNKSSKSRKRLARNTTYLMFIISIVFICSFVPYLTLLVWREIMKDFVDNLNDSGRTAYRFFLRSYFINAAANPIVYSIFDQKFRKEVKSSFLKLKEFLRIKI